MSKPFPGGPAFPGTNPQLRDCEAGKGMTLRDFFAAKALIAMGDRRWEGDADETAAQKHARACYSIADAMLETRE